MLRYALALVFLLSTAKIYSDDSIFQFSQINPAYNVTFSNNSGGFNLGYKFFTNESLTITALGQYDDFGDGFLNDHPVALYDINGNILATVTVTNASPLNGLFRYEAITPLVLPANQFFVLGSVAGYSAEGNPVDKYTHDPFDLSIDPRITFIENREIANTQNNLVFPTLVEVSTDPPLNYGWFGPNMLALSIPEPATLLTLGGSLILAFKARKRKIKNKS